MDELPESHKEGHLSVENLDIIMSMGPSLQQCDFGLQIARDGRVWVCVNGIAFLRFKPNDR
jgi:hypothetical protein